MSAPFPPFPTRPDEVPADATVADLLDAYQGHLVAVAAGWSRAPQAMGPLARHVVAPLAIAQAILDAFTVERWPPVRGGLAAGATVTEVGTAMGGLEVDEIAAGLGSWADRQHRAGALSLDDYDAVIALVAGGAR